MTQTLKPFVENRPDTFTSKTNSLFKLLGKWHPHNLFLFSGKCTKNSMLFLNFRTLYGVKIRPQI